jgi:hypothetical protein
MQAMAVVARSRLDQVEQKLRALEAMRTQLLTFITQLETASPAKCLAPGLQPPSRQQASGRA